MQRVIISRSTAADGEYVAVCIGDTAGEKEPSLSEREHALPILLHADNGPAFRLRFVDQRLGEDPHLGVGQPLRRAGP